MRCYFSFDRYHLERHRSAPARDSSEVLVDQDRIRQELAKRIARLLELRKLKMQTSIIERNIELNEQLSRVEQQLNSIAQETHLTTTTTQAPQTRSHILGSNLQTIMLQIGESEELLLQPDTMPAEGRLGLFWRLSNCTHRTPSPLLHCDHL